MSTSERQGRAPNRNRQPYDEDGENAEVIRDVQDRPRPDSDRDREEPDQRAKNREGLGADRGATGPRRCNPGQGKTCHENDRDHRLGGSGLSLPFQIALH